MKLAIPAGDFDGYIFDLDGTLVDTMPLHYLAWSDALRRFGLDRPLDEDYFYSLGGVPTLLVAQRLGEHYGLSLDAARVEHVKEELYVERLSEAKLIEPVVAFARSVAGRRPVAVVTGGMPQIAHRTLTCTGLDALFPLVVTPADVPAGRGKPAPDMFRLAADRMGVSPARCLVFEDADPGITGARAAGMPVVHVPSRGLAESEAA